MSETLELFEPVPEAPVKKAPRKPRPSEIAKKAAKAKAAKKPPAKKKAVNKPAKKAAKPKKKKEVRTVISDKAKRKTKPGPGIRTARLDLRVTPGERKTIEAFAKRKGLTLTLAVMAIIAKMR